MIPTLRESTERQAESLAPGSGGAGGVLEL